MTFNPKDENRKTIYEKLFYIQCFKAALFTDHDR